MSGQELLGRMDRAAATMDLVTMCALARLNWRLIDADLLAMSMTRLVQAQQVQAQQAAFARQAQQRAEISRLQSQLRTEQLNSTLGQAAIAIGANPSDYMVSSSPAASWGGGMPAVANPMLQVYSTVHQVLVQAAQLRGAPDPGVAPAIAKAAGDILDGRVKPAAAVKMLGGSAPAALRFTAAIPFVGDKLVGPMIRGAAVSALPLLELYRRMPDALLGGQLAPTT